MPAALKSMTIEDDADLDLRVRCGLLGVPQEQEEAITLLVERYKNPLMAYLRKEFPQLPSDELASAVNDTFIAVQNNADRIGRTDDPLSPFLFTVAKRRGIDARRKRASRIQTDDELTEGIAKAIECTQAKAAWERLRQADRIQQIIDEFRAFVATLKGKQLLVASVFADHLPHLLAEREIADEIYQRTGQIIPSMHVKGARAAMLQKFRELLERRAI